MDRQSPSSLAVVRRSPEPTATSSSSELWPGFTSASVWGFDGVPWVDHDADSLLSYGTPQFVWNVLDLGEFDQDSVNSAEPFSDVFTTWTASASQPSSSQQQFLSPPRPQSANPSAPETIKYQSATPTSSTTSNGAMSDASSWAVLTPESSPAGSSGNTVTRISSDPVPPKPLPSKVPQIVPKARPSASCASQSTPQTSAALGPCSRTWDLPPRIQKKKKDKPPQVRERRPVNETQAGPGQVPRRRGAYTDEVLRHNTAWTRQLRSCIRCRMNRGRCEPDLENPAGACLTCKRVRGHTLSNQPCFRYIVTDASLYRHQDAPFQLYSRRWSTMEIIDIPASDWASPEIRTIVVSPNHVSAPFSFEVRKFHPAPGDSLTEEWVRPDGVVESVELPNYAVADMNATAGNMRGYLERNVSTFIAATVGGHDDLLWQTYWMAFSQIGRAKTPEESGLLANAFRLWVMCRLISNPVHICGPDTLDEGPVPSPYSPHAGKAPMPHIMTVQFECINYTTFLRPLSKAVLKQLNDLVLAKKREYWFTIYLTLFVMLHSCSLTTRRDAETARQYRMGGEYANPDSIRAHHCGVQTILAHYHFLNKGVVPFSLPHTAKGRRELSRAASLSDQEVEFVWETSRLVAEPRRATYMKEVRERGDVGDDLYWVSMLYDADWRPQAND